MSYGNDGIKFNAMKYDSYKADESITEQLHTLEGLAFSENGHQVVPVTCGICRQDFSELLEKAKTDKATKEYHICPPCRASLPQA